MIKKSAGVLPREHPAVSLPQETGRICDTKSHIKILRGGCGDDLVDRPSLRRVIFEAFIDREPHLADPAQVGLAYVCRAVSGNDACVRVANLVHLVQDSRHSDKRPTGGVVHNRVTSNPEEVAGVQNVRCR